MIRTVAVLVMALVLAGCTRTVTVYVDRNTIRYSGVDDQWLTSCTLVPPPNRFVYDTATPRQKLDMWAQTYIDQANGLEKDNLRLQKAYDYNRKKKAEVKVMCDGAPCE